MSWFRRRIEPQLPEPDPIRMFMVKNMLVEIFEDRIRFKIKHLYGPEFRFLMLKEDYKNIVEKVGW